jgi:Ca-activated chloride channel family protein
MWSFQFAYPFVLYIAALLLSGAAWYRYKYYQNPIYLFPLTGMLVKSNGVTQSWRSIFFTVTRFLTLIALALLIARPQLVDEQSKVMVQGIDIMLVLDVSGSMQLFDDPHNQKQRIAIAKEEAVKFVKKRENDPIGLVLFGNEAVSRCPLTLDKIVLESIISDIQLGVINAEGTVLAKGLITALGRLKNSEAASKIIILLTDGEPSPGDLHPDDAIALAQKYGVKIYTIGIGGKYGGLFNHQLFGMQQASMPLNTKLLKKLAQKTGGKAFVATNQQELQTIYDTIDQLEKTEYETDLYQNYQDIFFPFLVTLAFFMMFELLLATFLWWGL